MDKTNTLGTLIETFEERIMSNSSELAEISERVLEATQHIDESWSGSALGYHAKLYYGTFCRPPARDSFNPEWGGIDGLPKGWGERSVKEVMSEIERRVGRDGILQRFHKETKQFRRSIETLRDEFAFEARRASEGDSRQICEDTLAKIESYSFGTTASQYVSGCIGGTKLTRDMRALSGGTVVPTHVYYAGIAHEAKALHENARPFVDLCNRFIRLIGAGEARLGVNEIPLHPLLVEQCASLLEKRMWPEATERAFKVVRDRLRVLTGFEKGSDAFGRGKLRLEPPVPENVLDDFNAAIKFLTMAIDMFRNCVAHTAGKVISSAQEAQWYLAVCSLALRHLESADSSGMKSISTEG